MSREAPSAEELRLRAEVRELRERRLTLRVDRQGDLISEVAESVAASSAAPSVSASGFEAVSSVASGTSRTEESVAFDTTGPPYSQEYRDAVAREIGRFLRKSLNGENRGESGRDKLRGLQSRYHIVVRDAQGNVHDPVIVCDAYHKVRTLCH